MTDSLVLIVSTGIGIVDVHTHTYTLACVGGKLDIQVVFTIGFVAAVVVAHIGDGRQRIGEMQLIGLCQHHIVDIGKGKLMFFLYFILSVFPADATENRRHIHVVRRGSKNSHRGGGLRYV